jgi:hypothetical protein
LAAVAAGTAPAHRGSRRRDRGGQNAGDQGVTPP